MVLIWIVYMIGILIGLFVIELFLVALFPGFEVPPQTLEKAPKSSGEALVTSSPPRKDVRFFVNGTALSAWLYIPEQRPGPLPCIIMGHGLGGTKDAGLEPYAIRFQEAGLAVFAFDYRYFGESEGTPRHLAWFITP